MKCRLSVSALPPMRNGASPSASIRSHQGVVVVLDVGGLVRRPDTGHRLHRRALVGGGDHGRATEGVPDEQPHLAARAVHVLHRADRVGDLVGERPVTPVALGVAQAEVVEAEHADALAGELLADPARGRGVLAEREAVGEDAPPAHLALRQIDETRQDGSGGAREADALGHARHPVKLRSARRVRRALETVSCLPIISSTRTCSRVPSPSGCTEYVLLTEANRDIRLPARGCRVMCSSVLNPASSKTYVRPKIWTKG